MFYLGNFNWDQSASQVGQSQGLAWMRDLRTQLGMETRRGLQRFEVSADKITHRQTYLPDFQYKLNREVLFDSKKKRPPSWPERAKSAGIVCNEIFSRLCAELQTHVSELIHVSCTHYESPSAAQRWVADNNLGEHVRVTHLYHMGCYAALPALHTGGAKCLLNQTTTRVVHTEFSTFHFNPLTIEPEQLVVQSLFSDGAISYELYPQRPTEGENESMFLIKALNERIIPNTHHHMSWNVGHDSLVMSLSTAVPQILKEHLQSFIAELCAIAGIDVAALSAEGHFAIHPGGPRILETCAEFLNLKDTQYNHSASVLRDFGNMSSVTLPKIWMQCLADPKINWVCTLGFGPGLTLAGAIFQKCAK